MNKLEHKLLVLQQKMQVSREDSYETRRLQSSFLKAWKRYVKQMSTPYNPALLSELRRGYYE